MIRDDPPPLRQPMAMQHPGARRPQRVKVRGVTKDGDTVDLRVLSTTFESDGSVIVDVDCTEF